MTATDRIQALLDEIQLYAAAIGAEGRRHAAEMKRLTSQLRDAINKAAAVQAMQESLEDQP